MDIDTLALAPLPPQLGSLPCTELIELLIARNDCVPRALIDECARRGDEMVQALSRLPDDKRFWREDVSDGQWWLRLHAVMILGLIPSERAGLMLVRFMRRISKVGDNDLQDWVSGAWPALFANKPQSAIDAARDLATDRSIGWYMRACAFDVVTAAARAQGPAPLDRALDWLAAIGADKRQDRDVRMWTGHLLLSFPRARHRALLDRLAAEQTGPYPEFRAEEVGQVFEQMRDEPEWERFADPWKFYTPEQMEERRRRWEEDATDAEPDWEPDEGDDAGMFDEDDDFGNVFDADEPAWEAPPLIRAGPKVGRNDPCPCGSGKKYKHCHLNADEGLAPDELAWRRVRRAVEGLQPRIMEAGVEHFGAQAMHEAWRAFTLGAAGDRVDADSPHMSAFLSWFCYTWLPDPQRTQVPPVARTSTAAQAFLAKRGKRLDPLTQRYMEACAQAPFSFHEVLVCEPGRGFRLKDLLLGETRYVFEASGSEDAARGDVLYASVVEVDGVALVEGCGPVLIPPVEKPRIIALRASLAPRGEPIDRDRLRERDADVRRLYLEITDRLLTPSLPALQNTDGEPIEMRTLIYDVASPREAFDALKDLAGGEPDEALLSEAVFDESGSLSRVEFPWLAAGNAMHKSWNNTVLGTLRIDGARLTAQVNSAARAQRLSDLIAARLGERARKLPEVIQSMQSLLERERTPAQRAAQQRAAEENAELNSRPEVQALIAEMTRKHYREWVDEPVPALGNRTPRQAMKSAAGREAVEALVVQIERDAHRMQPPLDPSITRELRATLGLPPALEE
jgi:hypothetical protein